MGLFETLNVVSIVLFAVGMVLLLIEMFIPGFGIFGGLGLVALVLCIVFQAKTFLEGLILFLGIGVIVVALALIAARSFKRGRLYRSPLVLKDAAGKDDGYVSSDSLSHLTGKTGRSLTPLRPSGAVEIDGQKVDVVTSGEFIDGHSRIVVDKVVGARVIVRRLED